MVQVADKKLSGGDGYALYESTENDADEQKKDENLDTYDIKEDQVDSEDEEPSFPKKQEEKDNTQKPKPKQPQPQSPKEKSASTDESGDEAYGSKYITEDDVPKPPKQTQINPKSTQKTVTKQTPVVPNSDDVALIYGSDYPEVDTPTNKNKKSEKKQEPIIKKPEIKKEKSSESSEGEETTQQPGYGDDDDYSAHEEKVINESKTKKDTKTKETQSKDKPKDDENLLTYQSEGNEEISDEEHEEEITELGKIYGKPTKLLSAQSDTKQEIKITSEKKSQEPKTPVLPTQEKAQPAKPEAKVANPPVTQTFVPYATLKSKIDLPNFVDRTKLEQYLSDEEFREVFKVSKAEYSNFPTWKQVHCKKSAGLF